MDIDLLAIDIPGALWRDLKTADLLAEDVPVPSGN